MVKTPRTRHSSTRKEPVTIDLAPDEVSRVKDAVGGENAESGAAREPGPKSGPEPEPGMQTEAEASPAFGRPATPEAEPAPNPTPEPPVNEQAAEERAAPTPEDAGPTPSPQPAERPSRSGSAAGLFAGLLGGVAALAIAAGLQFAGLLPGAAPAPAPAVPDQVADHGPAIAALEAELASLRSELAALSAAGDGDADLSGRVGAVEEQLAALASGLDTVREEVAGLADRMENEGAGDGVAPAPVDLGPVEERLAALESALAAVREEAAPAASLSALEQGIETLRAELAADRDGRAQALVRLDALEAAVATLTGRVDEQAEAPATAIIIAASSLKAAIDRGTPFTTELDTYAALVPDAPQLEELRALAASGVPTRTQIAAESNAAANAAIAAARSDDLDAGLVDRLMGSMMGLVQVRPIGVVEGEGVPEIAARIDAAVTGGDYERAIAEFETLPPAAKAAAQPFIDRVRARHTADRLADEALAAALRG